MPKPRRKCKLAESIFICNTINGYCLTPKECKSISEAIRYAKETKLAYRIFVDGKCIKSGWCL